MKIIIRFKSGFELPITCEKFELSRSVNTGEIEGYSIDGITDNKPIFFRPEDVECVYRVMEVEYVYSELINKLNFDIDASTGDDDYMVGLRNGLRLAKSLVDGSDPQFEKCAEPKTEAET